MALSAQRIATAEMGPLSEGFAFGGSMAAARQFGAHFLSNRDRGSSFDSRLPNSAHLSRIHATSKRLFDIALCLVLLAPLAAIAVVLLLANPFCNKGPLLYVQRRMGKSCTEFWAWKFRTMVEVQSIERGPFDPLEKNRITSLGHFLRKSRIDELPQIINVLRGEMSLIGPRPDFYDHAIVYVESVQGYRERHAVLPGISGLAQTQIGYVDGLDGVCRKVTADLQYIRNASIILDLWIVWQTLIVVALRKGA